MVFFMEAVVLCLLFTALVVPSLIKDPLAWVSDYPPAIRERARELGLIPKAQGGLSAAVMMRKAVVSLVGAAVFALALVVFNGAETFREGFLLSYGLWLVMDWYDALVLDCLWFCHSKKAVIPGTEDLTAAYHDYGFHIKMSGIGMLLGLPVCLVAGLLVMWLAPVI